MLLAPTLSAAARPMYERWLFIKYALLGDAGRHNIITDRLRRELAPLEYLRGTDLVRQGTPFFWKNVNYCYINGFISGEGLRRIRRHLLMAAFDSFFELLPDGTIFTLDAARDSNIVLPRLGIRIPLSSNDAMLCRLSPTSLHINISGQCFSINLNSIEPVVQIPAIKIAGYDQMMLLPLREPALFEENYINDISVDITQAFELANKLPKCLDLIKVVNPELASRIMQLVKWLIPLSTSDPTTYHSFTSVNLLGVIFLSPSYSHIYLAEVIIHEFHHTELNILLETQQVFKKKSDELKDEFYSPWRNDPRPLDGLLHALHVFSGILDFYTRAEKLPNLKMYAEQFRERRIKLYHQLRLCIAQVPGYDLTPIGHRIIKSINVFLSKQGHNLGLLSSNLPISVQSHLKIWCEKNPELASRVKMPQ